MKEARITINGVVLDLAQSTTLSVAIGSLQMEMQDPYALGTDETGR